MGVIPTEFAWVILGILLILMEFVLPGLIVIFFGIGALAVGILIWAGMLGGGALPFVVFSGVSIGSLLILRNQFKSWFMGRSLGVQVTGEDEDFVGRKAEVISGFSESPEDIGRVSYRGALWDARAIDEDVFNAGEKVRIVGREGSVLIIKRG